MKDEFVSIIYPQIRETQIINQGHTLTLEEPVCQDHGIEFQSCLSNQEPRMHLNNPLKGPSLLQNEAVPVHCNHNERIATSTGTFKLKFPNN